MFCQNNSTVSQKLCVRNALIFPQYERSFNIPAYQQIIGMGPRVLPLILRELEHKPEHWFWALRLIAQEDPVLPDHRGVVAEMTQDWLKWGRRKGLRW